MFEYLQNKILPLQVGNQENIAAMRCLLAILLAGIPLTGVAALFLFFYDPGLRLVAVSAGIFLLVQIIALWILRRGLFRSAGFVMSGGLWGMAIFIFAFWNETTSSGFPLLLISLFATQLILGEAAAVANAAASIVLTSIWTFVQYAVLGHLDGSSAGFQMLVHSSLISVAAGLSVLIGRGEHWELLSVRKNQQNSTQVDMLTAEVGHNQVAFQSQVEGQRDEYSGRFEFELPDGEMVWSEETFRILRRDPALGTLAMSDYMELVHPEDRSRVTLAIEQAVTQQQPFVCIYRILAGDNEIRRVHSQGEPELDAAGNVVRIVGAIQEVTEYFQQDRKLPESELRYQGLFENSPISLWEVDYSKIRQHLNGLDSGNADELYLYFVDHPEDVERCFSMINILVVNQATVELLEAEDKEQVYHGVDKVLTDTILSMFHQQLVSLIHSGRNFQGEATLKTFQGNEKHVTIRVSVAPGHEEQWDKIFISLLDISGRKKLEAQLQGFLAEMVRQSRTDSLTGLLNRRAMLEYAGAELNRIQRNGGYYSIMLIDLDYLKDVNDQHGHQAGNEALRLLAQTLQEEKRAYDWAGRWGGDEFILVLPDIELQKAYQIAQRLLVRFKEKNLLVGSGEKVNLTTSIGIAGKLIQTDEVLDLNVLLREADQALYQAKQLGRNQVCRYDKLPAKK